MHHAETSGLPCLPGSVGVGVGAGAGAGAGASSSPAEIAGRQRRGRGAGNVTPAFIPCPALPSRVCDAYRGGGRFAPPAHHISPREARHARPPGRCRPPAARACSSAAAPAVEAAAEAEAVVRFRARFAYDGTGYCGWQFQPGQATVQGEIEAQIARKLNGVRVPVVGASRTDSGVHGRGQVAHFDIPAAAAAVQLGDEGLVQNFQFTLNRMLPADIRIYGLERAPMVRKVKPRFVGGGRGAGAEDEAYFNAIYDSRYKLYSYRVSVEAVPDPLERLQRFHYWRGGVHGFDVSLARAAGQVFVGTHDFTAFTNAGPKTREGQVPAAVVRNPVRTVRSVAVVEEGVGRFRIDVVLEGALYRMVRNFVGAMLEVGAGTLEPGDLRAILESRKRFNAPRGAPAHGLCLEQVYYDV